MLSMEMNKEKTAIIEKYGAFFIQEYKHYLKLIRITNSINPYNYEECLDDGNNKRSCTKDLLGKAAEDCKDIRNFFSSP